MKARVYIVGLLIGAVIGLIACKKAPTIQEVCEKMADPAEVEDCVGDITRELAECTNAEDILKCASEAPDDDTAEACFELCQTAEGSGN